MKEVTQVQVEVDELKGEELEALISKGICVLCTPTTTGGG